MMFLVFWSLISTWLFPVLADIRMYGLLIAAAQVALGMLPLYYLRKRSDRSLTLPLEMFEAPFFSLKNTLTFYGANLFIVPFVLMMFVLTTADAYMTEHTSGFMRLSPGGLKMTERVYKRDNRTIRLAAMIHVGSKKYYDDLVGSLAAGRTCVLAEGITDDRNLMRNRIDYGRVAGFLGLTSQQEMRFKGRLIDQKELESLPQNSRDVQDGKQAVEADIFRADVDISAFRPPTITFLDAIGKHLQESPSFVRGVLTLNSWAEKNVTPEMHAIIMDDILHRRNMVVIGYLEKALVRYDTVVIPWGALHMKEIEEEILKRGFVLQAERQRVSIDFGKMLLGRL
jgi:hypothetical protein